MVEQMTQRWHGESCRETCHFSLKLRGAEVSKLTEALGFGSPASQSLMGCFPTKQPHSVWQQHGAGQCALIRPTAFIRTSPQLPADAFHLEPHKQEPLCWCFLNNIFDTRYLSTTGELPVCSRESLPSCLLVSHQLWYPMRSPWGSPKCQHPSTHHPRALSYITCPILGSPNICGTISAYSCMFIKKRERAQSRGSAII